jgi:hypothetical protein
MRTVGTKVPNYITLQLLSRWCCTFSLPLGDPMGQSRAFVPAEVLLEKEVLANTAVQILTALTLQMA